MKGKGRRPSGVLDLCIHSSLICVTLGLQPHSSFGRGEGGTGICGDTSSWLVLHPWIQGLLVAVFTRAHFVEW